MTLIELVCTLQEHEELSTQPLIASLSDSWFNSSGICSSVHQRFCVDRNIENSVRYMTFCTEFSIWIILGISHASHRIIHN